MAHIDYRALAVLEAVASHGSFEKAALALGISQSAVSQRIKTLEDGAGRLLIVRGQPAEPTGLGQRLITHYRHVQLMEASLDIDLGNQVTLPEVAIALDADSLATWFPASLAALLAPPRCQLQVRQADSETALQLLRDGSVFGCVATDAPDGHAGAPAASVSTLGLMSYVCVATPVFAGHWFGDGFSAEAAHLAPAVVGDRQWLTRLLGEQLGFAGRFPQHVMPAPALRDACMTAGLAYGLMPLHQAVGALAEERLVDLLPGHTLDVPLSWHAWTLDTPYTQLLTEQIVSAARAYLRQA